MRQTQSITFLLIGAFLFSPLASFAEETDGALPPTPTITQGEGTPPVPTLYRENPPRKPPVMMRSVGKVATGTRMMASGTRPLPAAMEKRIETRDARAEKLRADCVTQNGTAASGTDCITPRAERKEEVRDRVASRQSERIKALATVLVKRLNAAIERETKLADRIDSRILKLQTRSVITTEAETKIKVARTKIAEAKSAIETATTRIAALAVAANTSSASSTQADFGKPAREEMTKAKESLIAAHKALVDAVTSLKVSIKARTTAEAASSSSAQ